MKSIIYFAQHVFCRYSGEDEGLPTCGVKLAYKIIREWHKWNPCGWNGMFSASLKKPHPTNRSTSFACDYKYISLTSSCNCVSLDILSFSRGLVKHYKPYPCLVICTSLGELLDLTWWLLQNPLLETGWMRLSVFALFYVQSNFLEIPKNE